MTELPIQQDVKQLSRFLAAAHRQSVDATPVWFMRQAGRALPEYRALRERHSLLEMVRHPELAAEVTLQPVRRLGVDAAILFSDIVVPLLGMGVSLDIVPEVGPVLERPVDDRQAVEALRPLVPQQDVPFVAEAVRLLVRELGGATPLIGFAGAPFTLATYLVEGRPSRQFTGVKTMMLRDPDLWHALMAHLTDATIAYLEAQADAGAAALQLFDSWVGALSPADYREFVSPYMRRIFDRLEPRGLPLIHFGTQTAGLLEEMRDAGGTVIGVDWRQPLDLAWARIGHDRAIQGNLDPAVLLGPEASLIARTTEILRAAAGRPGHIFNLGHGVLPSTPVGNLQRVVEAVHTYRLEEGPLCRM